MTAVRKKVNSVQQYRCERTDRSNVHFADGFVTAVYEVGVEDRKSPWMTAAVDRARFQHKVYKLALHLEKALQFRLLHTNCFRANHTTCIRHWMEGQGHNI